VRFGELVDTSALQGTGYVPGTFHVPFHTAPDLYTWRRRPFLADIRFRAPPGPIIDVAASRLDVGINGIFLRSYSLAPTDTTWDWVQRNLGISHPVRRSSTPIPLYTVFGANDLQMYFDARPMHRGDCVAIPEDLHLSVDPDSTIDFSNAYHFTQLPNLAFFVNSGFPFTRLADLSETAIVLPQQPSSVELTAFLDLMGKFAALTGQPVNRVTVVRASEAMAIADKDVLLLGTLNHLSPAADLLRRSPYRLEGDSLRVELPGALSDIWHLFGDTAATDRRRAMAELAAPLGTQAAVMIGAESPNAAHRSVLALIAGSPQGLDAMVDAMNDTKLVPNIQGDLAILNASGMTSYRAGGTYTVGHLPFWLWPQWWLEDEPGGIIAAMLAASGMMAICLYGLVQWRARRRTGQASTEKR
jgi:cellulose synthase (UDP-forming)